MNCTLKKNSQCAKCKCKYTNPRLSTGTFAFKRNRSEKENEKHVHKAKKWQILHQSWAHPLWSNLHRVAFWVFDSALCQKYILRTIHSVRELGSRLVTNSILQDLDEFVIPRNMVYGLCMTIYPRVFRGSQGGTNLKNVHGHDRESTFCIEWYQKQPAFINS